MATPCILTLHSAAGIITGKADITAYLIRHMFARPGRSSILYEELLMSFRVLDANVTQKSELPVYVEGELNKALLRYFPDNSVNASCEYVDNDKNEKILNIRVYEIVNNQPTLLLSDANIKNTNNPKEPFEIIFKGE